MKLGFLILCIVATLIISGCASVNIEKDNIISDVNELPSGLLEASRLYMITQCGENYFNNYITFVEAEKVDNQYKSKEVNHTFYKIIFALNHPETPELHSPWNEMYLVLDSNDGKDWKIYTTYEILDCADNPSKCPPFKISRPKANEIIRTYSSNEKDFEPYINFWDGWSYAPVRANYSGYVWEVDYQCREGGCMFQIRINPETGQVLYIEKRDEITRKCNWNGTFCLPR
jgi:hypothetical protein